MKKKVFIGLGLAFALFIFYTSYGWRWLTHSRHELIQRGFAGQQNFSVVTSSPQVTVQRLHEKSGEDSDFLTGYTKDAPLALSPEQAQKVKDLLQSPSSYLWNMGSCLPHYGVLFDFQSDGHTVRVALCFKCKIIGIFEGEDDNARPIYGVTQFNPSYGQFVALCKTIFPNDKEIQALQ
jgi:hypothetical protein